MYCGAVVRYAALDRCEARLIGVGDRAVICVNNKSRVERQRFSVGHELGHWLADRGRVSFLCAKEAMDTTTKVRSPIEEKANRFAAELLLPRYLLKERLKDAPMTVDTVTSVASSYTTSLRATAVRIVELGFKPTMAIVTEGHRRLWFTRSSEVPKSFWPHSSLGPAAGIDELVRGSRLRTDPEEFTADSFLDVEGAEDYDVVAQSIRLDGNMVLTMLWWQDESQILDALDDD